MFFKLSGPFLIIAALLGSLGEYYKLEFPTVRFPFALARQINWLSPWFGWLFMALMLGAGIWCSRRFWSGDNFTPITRRRIERFKSIKRGYISLLIVSVLAIVAGLDHVIVGKEALAVRYQGEWSFPAFTRVVEKGADYGVKGDQAKAPADYRKLKKDFLKVGGNDQVWMPLIAFDPTGDTVAAVSTGLNEEEGVVREDDELFSGLGSKIYDLDDLALMHLRFRFRKGVKDGPADGWDRDRNRVYGAQYEAGKLLEQTWNGQGGVEDFLGQQSSGLRVIHFSPSPPTAQPGQRHLLGTNSSGYDVVAYLFGGLQVNFKAALVYIPLVYALGVSIGLLMGFFGGWFGGSCCAGK